jgi:hypothetical protein
MLTFLHENLELMRIHLGPRYLKTLSCELGWREYQVSLGMIHLRKYFKYLDEYVSINTIFSRLHEQAARSR